MDNHNTPNNNPPNQVPIIPESEMKLPEEQFGETTETPAAKSSVSTPILLGLVVVLLAILTAVVIWGEEIVDMFMPATETMPLEEEMTTEPESEGATLEDIESELDTVDFTAMEEELNAIEAEIDAEASAETP